MNQDKFTILISVLGVILTGASVVASIAQYRAANLQAKAAVAALQPQIEVRSLLDKKYDSEKYNERNIIVVSDGGPVYNFNSERLTWLEVRQNGKTKFKQDLIGFYYASQRTGKIKGELEIISGFKNHEKFINFLDATRSKLLSGYELIQPQTIINITYTDSLKNNISEYIHIDGGRINHLSDSDGEALWVEQLKIRSLRKSADIDKLFNPNDIEFTLNLWPENIKNSYK